MQVMDAARDYRYRYVAEMHVHATRTLSTLSSRSESPRWRTDFNSDPIYKRMALATPEVSMEMQLAEAIDGRKAAEQQFIPGPGRLTHTSSETRRLDHAGALSGRRAPVRDIKSRDTIAPGPQGGARMARGFQNSTYRYL